MHTRNRSISPVVLCVCIYVITRQRSIITSPIKTSNVKLLIQGEYDCRVVRNA